MKKLLDDYFNCNNDIFVLPSQEGGIEGDNYLASIGDSSLEHLQNLSHSQRQIIENFIFMKDGNIFRLEPNPFNRDKDPFNLEKEEDLEKAFEQKVLNNFKEDIIDPEFLEILKKEFKKEVQKRQDSEDIFNRRSGVSFEDWKVTLNSEEETGEWRPTPQYIELIPYHKWEEHPQDWRNWDIEPTPKPMFVWSGRANSYFYDESTEHHPSKYLIDSYLNLFNRDWDEITEEYGKWTISLLIEMNLPCDVKGVLEDMTEELVEGKDFYFETPIQPDEVIRKAMKAIDDLHRNKQQQT